MSNLITATSSLKLTSTNIKSSLIGSNKKIAKLRVSRIKLLNTIAKEEKTKKEEKKIESPIKGIKPIIGGAFNKITGMIRPIKDGLLNVFGTLLLAFAIDKLPAIIKTLRESYEKVKPIWTSATKTLKTIFDGIISLKPFADQVYNFSKNTFTDISKKSKELAGIETEIDSDLKVFDGLFGEPEEPKEEPEQEAGTNIFSGIGSFFTNLFTGQKNQTKNKNKIKTQTSNQKTDLSKVALDYQAILKGYRKGTKPSTAGTPITTQTAPTNPKSGTGTVTSGSLSGTKAQKWAAVMNMARKAGAKYPELVAAQFALESAWGTALAGKNNYFGIKAASGESYTLSRTHEVYNGKTVYIDDKFKNFSSPQDAINHLVNQWYKDYKGYRGVNNAPNAAAAAMMLKSQGYATDPVYANSLQRLMREYSDVRPQSSITPIRQNRTIPQSPRSSGGGTQTFILPFGIEKIVPMFQGVTESEVNSTTQRRYERRGNLIP